MRRSPLALMPIVILLVVFSATSLLADETGGMSVLVELPNDGNADKITAMRQWRSWLSQRDIISDRCGVNVEERKLIVDLDSRDQLDELLSNGFLLREPESAPRGGGVQSEYFDPGEIAAILTQVATDHPTITRLFTIGTTIEGRNILALEISDQPGIDQDEPAILLNGLHHSREVVTPHIIVDAIHTLTDGYAANDPQAIEWVTNYRSIMVPMVNPDGSAYTFAIDDFHRKNTRDVCAGFNPGVDLNRNYPYKWGAGVCELGTGSSGSTCNDAYRGSSPASEPETSAMMALADEMNFAVAVSYHSFGRFIDYPYACNPGVPDQRMPEHAIITEMMVGMAGAIFGIDGVDYDVFSPVALGPVNGDDTSWYYAHMGTYAMIVETATSFQPPFAQVPGIVARNRAGWQYLYDRLGEARIDVHVVTGCEPLEAEVTIVDFVYDTGELPRITSLPFGRWSYLVPANASYTIRVEKSGYLTAEQTVNVGANPAFVDFDLVPIGGSSILAGDVNEDCVVNGADIAGFVSAVLDGPAADPELRARGDFDADCVVTQFDLAPFVAAIMAGNTCP